MSPVVVDVDVDVEGEEDEEGRERPGGAVELPPFNTSDELEAAADPEGEGRAEPHAPPGLLEELETASRPLDALALPLSPSPSPSPRREELEEASWEAAFESIGSGRRVSRRFVSSTLYERREGVVVVRFGARAGEVVKEKGKMRNVPSVWFLIDVARCYAVYLGHLMCNSRISACNRRIENPVWNLPCARTRVSEGACAVGCEVSSRTGRI